MGSNEFEIEFQSDKEATEMLDSIIAAIGGRILSDEEKTAAINPIKLQQMQFAYGILKYMIGGTAAKLTYELNKPFKSMGSISIEGCRLTFVNSEWFARAAEFASNTEVYPLRNGNVKMTFTFHGLTQPIE